jgi:hypothetical protein
MDSKGQNAVEYLMTYGWALLIILVVGVAVWQMGFLNISDNVAPGKSGFSQVTPMDWSLSEDKTLTVVVQNNAGTIVSLEAVGTAAYLVSNGAGICGANSFNPDELTFRPADTRQIIFEDCPVDAARAGEYYRVNLTIQYTNTASQLTHKSNGMIWGSIG